MKLAQKERLQGILLILPALIFVIALIFFPMVWAIVQSFLKGEYWQEQTWSLDNYRQVFFDSGIMTNLVYSIGIACLTSVIVFVCSYPLSIYLRFSKDWFSQIVARLYMTPLFVPGIIATYAMVTLMADHGVLQGVLNHYFQIGDHFPRMIHNWKGVILVGVWKNVTFMTIILSSSLQEIEDSFIDSARDMGANWWQIFCRVIFPLSLSGAVIALAFIFMGSFAQFSTPFIIDGNFPRMFAVEMRYTFSIYNETQKSAAMAVTMFLVSMFVAALYIRYLVKGRKV